MILLLAIPFLIRASFYAAIHLILWLVTGLDWVTITVGYFLVWVSYTVLFWKTYTFWWALINEELVACGPGENLHTLVRLRNAKNQALRELPASERQIHLLATYVFGIHHLLVWEVGHYGLLLLIRKLTK